MTTSGMQFGEPALTLLELAKESRHLVPLCRGLYAGAKIRGTRKRSISAIHCPCHRFGGAEHREAGGAEPVALGVVRAADSCFIQIRPIPT